MTTSIQGFRQHTRYLGVAATPTEDLAEQIELPSAGVVVIDGHQIDLTQASADAGVQHGIYYFGRQDATFVLEWNENRDEYDPPSELKAMITSYPSYPVWPTGQTEAPQTVTTRQTLPASPEKQEDQGAAQATAIADWKGRLIVVADAFEHFNHADRWGHEEHSGGTNGAHVAVDLDPTDADALAILRKIDNTSLHWPKGIGLAWRTVKKYEDAASTSYGVPTRVEAHDGTTTTLDLTQADPYDTGLEALVALIETEYHVVGKAKPIYFWHYAAGNNEGLWTAYYNARQWWTTNFTTAQGGRNQYTAADDADWEDLYDEYKDCLLQ